MKNLLPLFFCLFISIQSLVSQNTEINLPKQLPPSVIKANPKMSSNTQKKVFLIFNFNGQDMADYIYQSVSYLADNDSVIFTPIFINTFTDKDPIIKFSSSIQLQKIRSLEASAYSAFQLKDSELPILIAYDTKNQLCGSAQRIENLSKIKCIGAPAPVFLKLKALVQDDKKSYTPYTYTHVLILNGNKTDTLAILKTNEYGEFSYRVFDRNIDYVIQIPDTVQTNVLMATQTGKVIGEFTHVGDDNEYKIFKDELSKLPDLKKEDDTEVRFTSKNKTKEKDFIIIKATPFEKGKNDLTAEIKATLDDLYTFLSTNKKFKLEITNHTDAEGDDNENLKLTEARATSMMEYLQSKGIDKSRITIIGKGETVIRNRCLNGVYCSPKEQAFNQRTEFRIYKK